MSWDAGYCIEHTIDTLNADATIQTLLGGQEVFRGEIPRDVPLPAVAVGIQDEGERLSMVTWGANTHSSTPAIIRVSIWNTTSAAEGPYTKIKSIVSRADVLLDNQSYPTYAGGTIFQIRRWAGGIERDNSEGDYTLKGLDIFYEYQAKAA